LLFRSSFLTVSHVLNPVKQYSLEFISDGIANVLTFDMSLIPISEDFRGNLPTGLILGSVSGPAGPITGVTFELTGQVVTITLPTAPLQLYNGVTAIYTATWYLEFPN
jgi:hypothetical protein